MKKRYAPDAPDSSLHRPGDTEYLRELLSAAGLSQRKAGPLLGMDERTMRYKVSGEKDLTYPEQYCLEVLADQARQGRAVHEASVEYGEEDGSIPPLSWVSPNERKLKRSDVGNLIACINSKGILFAYGQLCADEFGFFVTSLDDRVDERRTPIVDLHSYCVILLPKGREQS